MEPILGPARPEGIMGGRPRKEGPMGEMRRGGWLMAFGTAAAVLAAGAVACAHTTNPPGPASGPSTAPASVAANTASPSSSGSSGTSATPACTGGQLRANGSLQGAAGSREGAITFTNFSSTRCTLRGRPTITLLDSHLKPITSGVSFLASPPAWKADAMPKPAGWPVVTLEPGS